MNGSYLLPNKLKIIGWIFLIPSFLMALLWVAGFRIEVMSPVFSVWGTSNELFTVIHKDIYNEIISVPLLLSLLIVSFSKEKNEDEYITKLRLESLVWSIYINYSLLFLSIIFVFHAGFHNIMIYNMFTLLILFVCKFHYVLYKTNKLLKNEK